MLAILRSQNGEGADFLCNICFEQWAQAYDGGLRYGHMTSNLAECINSVLKGTCHLPITSVVRETYFRLAVLFPKQAATYAGQMQGGHVWCSKVVQEINKAKARANIMHTVSRSRQFVVTRDGVWQTAPRCCWRVISCTLAKQDLWLWEVWCTSLSMRLCYCSLSETPSGSDELCGWSVQIRKHVQRMETRFPTGPRWT